MTVLEESGGPVPATSSAGIWSRPAVSWMLYDLANTMFSFAILTFYFPPWLVSERGGNDALLSYAVSIAMLAMFFSAPILGALSDQTPRRMPFLVVSTLLCVLCTALLGQGSLRTILIIYGFANFFFQAGLIFYDALLPVVSTPENRGRISGFGIGIGYLGSLIALGAGYALIAAGQSPVRIFQLVALLFLLFALPCFLFVKEPRRTDAQPLTVKAVRDAFQDIGHTARRAREYPQLARFLVGRLFYTDVANTLISFMAIYVTEELNFSPAEVTAIGALSIISSVVGGFIWGLVVDRTGPKRTLVLVLFLWMALLLSGMVIPILGLPRELFYLVGALAGVGLAGLWASDRIMMLRLSPPRYLGQFYGLYSMVGRFGQIAGPLLWGFIAVTLGWGRPLAMFSLFLLTVVGFLIVRPVSDAEREWRPDELVPLAS